MARAASPGAAEVRLARFRIADEDVEDLVQTAIRIQENRGVQKLSHVLRLLDGQLERGHAFVRTPGAQKRAEFLSTLIALHELGPREVRPARSASRIRSVAEAALVDDDLFAAIDRDLVELRILCAKPGRR